MPIIRSMLPRLDMSPPAAPAVNSGNLRDWFPKMILRPRWRVVNGGELSKASIDRYAVPTNDGTVKRRPGSPAMATLLSNFLKNMPSPLVLIVAGYIGLRALEIALRPQEAFRTRMTARLMTLSAIGLFLAAVAFVLAEILGAVGVIGLPWPVSSIGKY